MRPTSLSLFSQSGRSAGYIWSALSPHRKTTRRRSPPDLDQELDLVKKLQDQAKLQEEKQKPRMSQAFKAISREQHEVSTRNRTESPDPCHYKPNWTSVRPRTSAGPKYTLETTLPREQVVYLPKCVEADCSHAYPKCNSEGPIDNSLNRSAFENSLRRTQRTFREFSEKAILRRSQWSPVADGPRVNLKSALDFKVQTSRGEFVKEGDSPHEGRFKLSNSTSLNRNSLKVDFSKVVGRPEVFPGVPSAPYYDVNTQTQHKHVLAFDKRPSRKANLNIQCLSTPRSPDLSLLQKSLKLTMKSPKTLPKMRTLVPRDDMMYRVTEAYIMNVPVKQLASDIPQHGGCLNVHEVPSTKHRAGDVNRRAR